MPPKKKGKGGKQGSLNDCKRLSVDDAIALFAGSDTINLSKNRHIDILWIREFVGKPDAKSFKKLNLSGCPKVDNACILLIARSLESLVSLTINDVGLRSGLMKT